MDFVKDKVNQASESLQGKGAEASAEQNKHVAKGDTDAGLGTQATAAKDYVVDKKDQTSHENKADMHNAKSEAR